MVSVGPVEVDEISLAELCGRYQVRELALFGSTYWSSFSLKPTSA